MERTLKVQEVIAKALAKKLTWWEAAEIMGVTDRTMRRWRERIEEGGYTGLYDRRKHPSPKKIPLKQALQLAGLVKTSKRGKHRKRRPRRPIPGMMLHIDGSKHQWMPGGSGAN